MWSRDHWVEREPFVRFIASAAIGLLFAVLVGSHGIPVLRHDWSWQPDRNSELRLVWATIAGWVPTGVGLSRPYPTDYLLAVLNAANVALLGNALGFAVFIFALGFVSAFAAIRLFARVSGNLPGAIAAGTFAVFNPWLYSKIIAGHVAMIVAYAGLIFLTDELAFRRTDPPKAALWCMMVLGQIQFFLLAFVSVAVGSAFSARMRLAALTSVIVAAPILVGLSAESSSLLSIPYTLTWQYQQSIEPAKAFMLLGYFAGYTNDYPGYGAVALTVIAAIAGLGALIAIVKGGPGRVIAAITVLVLLVAMGLKGPLAALYGYAVMHVPQTGVYRELYDLLGLVAIGYIALCAIVIARWRVFVWPWVIAVAAVAATWIMLPPTRFFVAGSSIAPVTVHAAPNSRIAVMPPFQPLSYENHGSGLDPAARVYPNGVTLLNDDALTYPQNVALARYLRSHDVSSLAALSVSQIIARSGFQTDYGALQGVTALPMPSPPPGPLRTSVSVGNWLPELALFPAPCVDIFPSILDDGCVFIGDAAGIVGDGIPKDWESLSHVRYVTPGRDNLRADQGWVDVRLAFAARPELGQGIGGALTTSPQALLPIRSGEDALVWVEGTLLTAEGKVVSPTTVSYAWVNVPANTHALRCSGTCVVAAESAVLHMPPEPLGSKSSKDVEFHALFPWIIRADLPQTNLGTIRYNVRFDRHWIALAGGTLLPHVRVDAVFNGWIVHNQRGALIICEYVALVQFVLELAGIFWAVFIVARILRPPSSSEDLCGSVSLPTQ